MTTPSTQTITVDDDTIRYLVKILRIERGLQIARAVMIEEFANRAKQRQQAKPETKETSDGD